MLLNNYTNIDESLVELDILLLHEEIEYENIIKQCLLEEHDMIINESSDSAKKDNIFKRLWEGLKKLVSNAIKWIKGVWNKMFPTEKKINKMKDKIKKDKKNTSGVSTSKKTEEYSHGDFDDKIKILNPKYISAVLNIDKYNCIKVDGKLVVDTIYKISQKESEISVDDLMGFNTLLVAIQKNKKSVLGDLEKLNNDLDKIKNDTSKINEMNEIKDKINCVKLKTKTFMKVLKVVNKASDDYIII